MTILSWGVVGTAEDNSGATVTGIRVTANPPPDLLNTGSQESLFGAYYQTPSFPISIGFSKDGYGSVPDTSFTDEQPAPLTVVLPPTDNLIKDGDFESGDVNTGWKAGGAISPQIVSDHSHTGQYSARLGSLPGSFAPAKLIGSSLERPQAGIDKRGIVHILYTDGSDAYYSELNGSNWSVPESVHPGKMLVADDGAVMLIWTNRDTSKMYYQRREPLAGWTTPEEVPGLAVEYDDSYDMSLDSQGNLHLVLARSYTTTFSYIQYNPRSGWSPIETTNNGNLQGKTTIKIAGIDRAGTLNCALTNNNQPYFIRRSSIGRWSEIEKLPTDGFQLKSPIFITAPQGDAYLAWIYQDNIYFSWRPWYGNWTTPQRIVDLADPISHFNMTLGPSGRLHLICGTTNTYTKLGLYYVSRDLGGIWSAPEEVTDSASWAENGIVEDAHGTLHAAWVTEVPHSVYTASKPANGSWSVPELLSSGGAFDGDPYGPILLADDDGNIHVLWGGNGQWYAGLRLATESGDSSISQTISIPADMHAPILSLMASLEGGYTPEDARFTIEVRSEDTSTIVYSASLPAQGWEHIWTDLSPWSGKTITLVLATHQPGDAPRVGAYLDDITVGSAHPDVWIQADSNKIAQPGDNLTVNIRYGNQGGATAQGTHLVLTLPEGLSLQSASLPPASVNNDQVDWAIDDLSAWSEPQTIQVVLKSAPGILGGTTLEMSLSIQTAEEIESANNTVWLDTLFDWRRYLPSVFNGTP